VAAAIGRAAAGGAGGSRGERGAKPVLANLLIAHPLSEVPSYVFPEAAALALARLVERAEWLAEPEGTVPEPDGIDLVAARMLVDAVLLDDPTGSWLEPAAAARLVGFFGIAVGQAAAGVETRVSVVQHASFGPVIRLAVGGATAELMGDHGARILPLTDVDAASLVRSLRASPLLFGWQGSPSVDVAALEDLLLRVSTMVEDVPQVFEAVLDVVVLPRGARAVDVKVRVAPHEPQPELALRRLR
jgi:acyl-CoA synthetase (NDP forming)